MATASAFIHQPADKLTAALERCLETGRLEERSFSTGEYIYLPDLAEEAIAARLTALARREKQTARHLDQDIQVLEAAQGFAYAPEQREAIRRAVTENCLVLTGGPGTGKTTTVKAVLNVLESQAERVALCAPTGRAAKRLSELTGRKASTIHRLLEVDYSGGRVSFIHNERNLLKCDVVILDEMSMVDVQLFQSLLAALRPNCRVIMVGDADQLPSVGPGNILGEVIRSGAVSTVCLKHIFRQAKRSLIVENAHNIVSGRPLQKGGREDDFFFLEADGEVCQKLVCDLVTARLPRSYGFDPIRDIQVLCPTKMGPCGTQALNTLLQDLLNPPAKAGRRRAGGGRLQRGHRHRGGHRPAHPLHDGADGRPAAGLPRREPGRVGTRLRHHRAQEPGQRVCRGGAAGGGGAAPAVLPQPVLHRRHPRAQTVRGGGPAGHRGRHDGQRPPEPALQRPCRAAEKPRPAAPARNLNDQKMSHLADMCRHIVLESTILFPRRVVY